jgi:hypothetical protein
MVSVRYIKCPECNDAFYIEGLTPKQISHGLSNHFHDDHGIPWDAPPMTQWTARATIVRREE